MQKNKNLSLVILAGGEGTRLKQIIGKKQKCIAKINNKPFLNYILNLYSKYNFKKIFILAGKNSKDVYSLYHKKEYNFIKVVCLKEKKLLGTAGALYKLRNKIDNFILVNGDSILDINLTKFLPKNVNTLCKMSLVKNENYVSNKKLSNLKLNKGQVMTTNSTIKYMNGGIYYFNNHIFNYIKNKKMSLEEDVLPNLILKRKINGEIFNNVFFYDIGTKENFFKSNKVLKQYFNKSAVFLDRDGVINHDYGYVSKFKDFKFREGVIKGLSYLIKKNYYIFIVTNQAGVAKNKFKLKDFKQLHIQIKNFLNEKNIFFDKVSFCPHHKNGKVKKYIKNCSYRKPQNGMIKNIFKNWDIDKKKSFLIGDQISDKICAQKSKLKFFMAEDDFCYQVRKIHNKYK